MVGDIYARAAIDHFCDPLLLVVAYGLQIRPVVDGERTPDRLRRDRFYYPWRDDSRVEGAGVYMRFASRLLGRLTHNLSDEHFLAAELAIPEICARSLTAAQIVALHLFAPVSWIEARVKIVSRAEQGSGVFYKPPELAS